MNEAGDRPAAGDPSSAPAPDSSPEASPEASPESQALKSLGQMLGEGSDLVRDYLDLIAVEGQLAGRSLVLMVAMAIVLGVLLVSAWILFSLAAALWLVERELLSPWQAVLAASAALALMALPAWLAVRRLARNLGFGGLRRSIDRRDSTMNDEAS